MIHTGCVYLDTIHVDGMIHKAPDGFAGLRRLHAAAILFLVYIDDLEGGVTGNISKFADDTKLFRKTKEIGDKQKLQDDIDKLVRWSEKWHMLFNVGKCKCLHT